MVSKLNHGVRQWLELILISAVIELKASKQRGENIQTSYETIEIDWLLGREFN